MKVPKKIQKTEIDGRFAKVLTDKKFNVVTKVNKYGMAENKQDKSMQKFYQKQIKKQESESEESEGDVQKINKYEDEEGNFQWNEEGQEEKEQVDIGKRLALTKMDWDNLTAVDILALFNSFCKGEMMVDKVEIYPSLLGIEKMKNDSLYGPSKEIYNKNLTEKKITKLQEKQEYLSDEELEEEGYDQEKLRKYELQKMNYFYAVIHCDSKKTAKKIYKEYNGYEFELTNLRINLSFISDSLKFPQEVKEAATEIPQGYEFKPDQFNKAKAHTKVKLTWDQTDPKRQKKLQQIHLKKEIDEEDYQEFIANSSSENGSDIEEDPEKIEEYRKKLLGGLSKDNGDIFRKKDLREQKEGDEELDVKFDIGFGEDIGKKIIEEKKEKKESGQQSQWEKYQEKRKEKKREKKKKFKEQKELEKKQGKLQTAEMREEENKKRAELELLIDKSGEKEKEQFKGNTKDGRFKAVLDNKDYAIDPTHREYKKVADGEFMKTQKNKRRKVHENE